MGASSFYTFRKIIFPLLSEALFTSFFIILIFCIGELTTVIMVDFIIACQNFYTHGKCAAKHSKRNVPDGIVVFNIADCSNVRWEKILFNQRWRTEEQLIVFQNCTKRFGKKNVLENISFSLEEGSFISILGKSGCGKTTLIRLLAGLENLDGGSIFINGEK